MPARASSEEITSPLRIDGINKPGHMSGFILFAKIFGSKKA
jgi:hypothetical protein